MKLDQILDAMNEQMDGLPWLRTIKWNHFIILLDSLNDMITQSEGVSCKTRIYLSQ